MHVIIPGPALLAFVSMIYLDHNATTQPSPEVVQAMVAAMHEAWHNPSSVHRGGQAARQRIELARRSIAQLINAKPRDVILTSSGTEALDLAVRGTLAAFGPSQPVLVTSRLEHACVRDIAEDIEQTPGASQVRWMNVTHAGVVDVTRAADAIAPPGAAPASVVVLQWANNETGAIQPLAPIAQLCQRVGARLIVDGTQWVGKCETDVTRDGPFDMLAFAPHKFHGPKGVGVLWARQGVRFRPRILGTQELGRRGGTENTPAIIGAGVACDQARQWLMNARTRAGLAALRDRFEQRLCQLVPTAVINGLGSSEGRLWNTTNIGFPHLEAEALLLQLSEQGVFASAGAACSSGSLDPSAVLLAMGIPEHIAHGSLRFSISKDTTAHDLEQAATLIAQVVARVGQSWTN